MRFPHLAAEWDGERNPDPPASVSAGSNRRVWWRCGAGHRYRAAVKSRAAGSGCPYCAGRAVQPEENSLAARYPALASEWDVAHNGALTPCEVTPGAHRKVWWRCAAGHSWQAAVFSRTRGSGCPYCSGQRVLAGETDLAARYPALAAEWDAERNAPLTPQQVLPDSNRTVWWRCPQGHSYAASNTHRTRSASGCPYCAGRKVLPGFNDLAAREPQLAAQWHPSLNGALTPQQVTTGSHRRVWWQCEAGHVWRAVVYSRTGGQNAGCPVCAGRIRQKQHS